MGSPSKLNMCLLLPGELYDPNMPPDPRITEIYGECLTDRGHQATWIIPAKATIRATGEERFGEARILPMECYTGSSLVKRAFTYPTLLCRQTRLASRVIRTQRCNLVIVRDDVFEGMLALLLKRRYRIPLAFEYTFPSGDVRFQNNMSMVRKLSCVKGKLERFFLPFLVRRADLFLVISKWMAENLANRGISKEKMVSIPNGVNADLFSPTVGSKQVRQEYGLSGSRVVIYQGTVDKLRRLDVLFCALALVKRDRQDVKSLIVGDGDDRANLDRLARNLGLESDVIFTGRVPYFEVPQFIGAADIAVSPVPPLDIYKVSSPLKLFEYMGLAKPVVANEEIPEHKEVLDQSGGGVLVPFTPEAFASAIIELLDNPQEAVKKGHKGREWVTRNRTYKILAQQMEERYLELLSNYGEIH